MGVHEFSWNDPVVEMAFGAVLCFILCVILVITLLRKNKERFKLWDKNEKLKVDLLKASDDYEALKKELNGILTALNGPCEQYKAVPIDILYKTNITDGVYQYFVDKDKKAEFALEESKRMIAKELLDKILEDDLIEWHNEYDTLYEEYKTRGRLLVIAKK